MLDAKVDHLVLGCSHYPYIIPQLKQLLPGHIKIIDSGEAVAKRTMAILAENDLLNNEKSTPNLLFFSNTKLDTLASLLEDFTESIVLIKKEF